MDPWALLYPLPISVSDSLSACNKVAVLTSAFVLAASLAGAQGLSKEAKIERLLALTNAEATINQLFEQVKTMASQMPSAGTPEQRARALELQARILDLVKSRLSWDQMRPLYVKVYSETFSDEEIDGILAFYQSPAGRAMLEKMPTLLPKVMAAAQAQMGDLMPEIQRLVREGLQN